jgi:DNA replication protein DnaC
MLIHPTVERLRALGLTAMADAFIELQSAADAGELSREDWLGLLVDREATSRENKRLARRLREARLRQSAVVEDVDFRAHRGLDRALFLKLASCVKSATAVFAGGTAKEASCEAELEDVMSACLTKDYETAPRREGER